MIRVIAIASLAFAVATSAQALTPAPMPQPEGLVSLIAAACGAGDVPGSVEFLKEVGVAHLEPVGSGC